MALTRVLFTTGLILLLTVFQVYADEELYSYFKGAKELTAEKYDQMAPNIALCTLPKEGNSCDNFEHLGKVVQGHDKSIFVCEYKAYVDGEFLDPHFATQFEWLDMTYDKLSGWLTALATPEMGHEGLYFVLRGETYNPEHHPAACVKLNHSKGFEFGYERLSNRGEKHCDILVGAIYYSPYAIKPLTDNELALDSGLELSEKYVDPCKHGILFSPPCHRCNGDGCGAFKCSHFTSWDRCPGNSFSCGYEDCVGSFCPSKPICARWK